MSIVTQRLDKQLRKIHSLHGQEKHRLKTVQCSPPKLRLHTSTMGRACCTSCPRGIFGGGDRGPRVGMCQFERTSRLQKESGMQKIITGLDS